MCEGFKEEVAFELGLGGMRKWEEQTSLTGKCEEGVAGRWGHNPGADWSQAEEGLEGHVQGLCLRCVIFVPRINVFRTVLSKQNLGDYQEEEMAWGGGDKWAA